MHERIDQLQTAGELPDGAQCIFDELDLLEFQLECQTGEVIEHELASPMTVHKTCRRRVVTLKYGAFDAREVVRQQKTGSQRQSITSSELARLVAPGCQYGYDLVAPVGLESFLHGRRLEEIQQNLAAGQPSIHLPTSSLDELRRRFLIYLGQAHPQAAPLLKESLQTPEGMTWLIDGTLEPGTVVFFGVQHARSGILLSCSKIPTENADDIAPCLAETANDYGRPKRILHELSSAMSLACQTAFSDVRWCRFHGQRSLLNWGTRKEALYAKEEAESERKGAPGLYARVQGRCCSNVA